MKKYVFIILVFLLPTLLSSQQSKYISSPNAKKIIDKAVEYSNVDEAIEFLDSTIIKTVDVKDKQCLQVFLAHLYEDIGMYIEAQKLFVQASVVEISPAVFSKEELLLYAARCALSCGETESAESIIRAVLRTAKDNHIIATSKLYSQWAQLCKIEIPEELYEPTVVLSSYLKMDSMKSVYPSILFTLWYVSGEESYADALKKDWPNTIEYSMVTGKTDVLPGPFWYFVPRRESSLSSDTKETKALSTELDKTKDEQEHISYLQLGFFQSLENAQHLEERLKKSGFKPVITKEKRESGTTYYVVIVYEDTNNSITEKLRNSGYEFYPVYTE